MESRQGHWLMVPGKQKVKQKACQETPQLGTIVSVTSGTVVRKQKGSAL